MSRKGKEELGAFAGKMHLRWDLRMVMARNKVKTATHMARMLEGVGLKFSSTYLSRLIDERPSMINLTLLDGLVCIFNCTPNDLLVLEPYEGPTGEHVPPAKIPLAKRNDKTSSQGNRAAPNVVAIKNIKPNVTHLPPRITTTDFVPKTEDQKMALDFLNMPAFVLQPKPKED
jgi:hypothetical protein